ncbi:MAG: hypothetical protein RhofKO_25160 [Rhodothermales bacterium]
MLLVLGVRFWWVPALGIMMQAFIHQEWGLSPFEYGVYTAIRVAVYTMTAYVLLHTLRIDPKLRRLRSVLWFATIGALLGPLVEAFAQVTWLSLSARQAAYFEAVMSFWVGDATGVAVFTPALVLLLRPWQAVWHQDRAPELKTMVFPHATPILLALLAVVALIPCGIFWLPQEPAVEYIGLLFLPTLASALWLGFERTVVVILWLNVVTIQVALSEMDRIPQDALQFALALVSISGLVLSSYASGRMRVLQRLSQAHQQAKTVAEFKDQLVGQLSAAVQEPMRGLRAQVGKAHQQAAPHQQFFVEAMAENTRRLGHVFSLFRHMAELEREGMTFEPEVVNVEQLVQEVESNLQWQVNRKALVLSSHVDVPDLLWIDPHLLRMVVYEFMLNAIKFTETGHVRLEVDYANDALRLAVADTGIGMASEQVQTMFEAFQQASVGVSRSYEGMGLGLPVIRRMIELAGGQLKLESRLGKGTTASVQVPVTLAVQEASVP